MGWETEYPNLAAGNQTPEERARRKFERIRARDPGNPDHDEIYLSILIKEAYHEEAERDRINARGEYNRMMRACRR